MEIHENSQIGRGYALCICTPNLTTTTLFMKTIFILDSDSAQQKLMTQHLNTLGFAVRSVFSVSEFETLSEKPFVIILDEKMDNKDRSGIEVLRQVIRQMPRVPVIYMMNRPESESISHAQKSGAYEVIEKNSAALVNLRTALDKLATEVPKTGWLTRLFGKKSSHDLPALSV